MAEHSPRALRYNTNNAEFVSETFESAVLSCLESAGNAMTGDISYMIYPPRLTMLTYLNCHGSVVPGPGLY